MGLPSHSSIYPSQMKYQMKKFWLKADVLYEQLLISVPYAARRPVPNGTYSLYTEQSINYFAQKSTFFLKFNKCQPLKLFFRDFSLSNNDLKFRHVCQRRTEV